MKKTICLLYLLLSKSMLLMAQKSTLNAVTNMYKIGDSIHYDLVDTRGAQAKLESEKTWDFSNSKYLGKENDIHFVGKDSTSVSMITPNAILHLEQGNNEFGLSRLQTPLIDLDFGHSFCYLKYPFTVGDSLLCIYSGNGRYSSKNDIALTGICKTKAVSIGSLIMPNNKPLSNSLLIKREINSRVCFAQDTIPNWQGESLNLQAIIYDWFAIGYRYPILKIIDASLLKRNKELQSYQVAYAVDIEALEKLTDNINEELRTRNALAESHQRDTAQKIIDYKLTTNGRNVNLTYSLSNDANLHFILSNSSGMVYRSNTKKLAKGEGYQQSINCVGLPSGEYVLYIQVNQQIYSEKLGLK